MGEEKTGNCEACGSACDCHVEGADETARCSCTGYECNCATCKANVE